MLRCGGGRGGRGGAAAAVGAAAAASGDGSGGGGGGGQFAVELISAKCICSSYSVVRLKSGSTRACRVEVNPIVYRGLNTEKRVWGQIRQNKTILKKQRG